MKWVLDDGGRSNYFKGHSGDCFVRAVAIATGKDYKEIYDLTNQFAKRERTGKRKRSVSSARNGVYSVTAKKVMEELGWDWHPTMTIGSGCQVHLREDEVPDGNVIVQVAKHYVAVINGVIHDTWDSQEDGNRCVYGYWTKSGESPIDIQKRKKEAKQDAHSQKVLESIIGYANEVIRSDYELTPKERLNLRQIKAIVNDMPNWF